MVCNIFMVFAITKKEGFFPLKGPNFGSFQLELNLSRFLHNLEDLFGLKVEFCLPNFFCLLGFLVSSGLPSPFWPPPLFAFSIITHDQLFWNVNVFHILFLLLIKIWGVGGRSNLLHHMDFVFGDFPFGRLLFYLCPSICAFQVEGPRGLFLSPLSIFGSFLAKPNLATFLAHEPLLRRPFSPWPLPFPPWSSVDTLQRGT
jgi:hypothetical protein